MANALRYESTLFDHAATAMLGGMAGVARVPFDESETEDIVLVREPAAVKRMASDGLDCTVEKSRRSDACDDDRAGPSSSESFVVDHVTPKRPPKRIGNGKLVSTRVQWRPGDPFGQAARAPARSFEWNRMVKSACVTAVCGLILVWLLHIA